MNEVYGEGTVAHPTRTSSSLARLVPSSMRYGHFRYYWLALLVGVTGHGMLLNFTMGWMMFELTGEERDLAFLGIAIAVPAIFLNFIGGVSADRFEPKYLVASAQSLSATVVVLLAILVWTDRAETWHLLVTAVAIGALQAFDQPSRASVFPRLVEREHIVNAVAMSEIVWSGIRVLGPILAGITIEKLSIHSSMFFSAASFYVVAIILSMLRLRPRPPVQGDVLSQVMEGIRYVRQRSIFLSILTLTFCNSMFGMAYVHLMPSFAKEVLDVGADKIGFLLGVSGAGAIVGTIIIANLKDHQPKGLIILAGAMLLGLSLILFSLLAWQGLYGASMAILVLVGMGNSLSIVGGMSTLQQMLPDRLRGRVMGFYSITWSLAPMGMAQGGFVAQYFGAPAAVAFGGMIIMAVTAFLFLTNKEIRALRAAPYDELQSALDETEGGTLGSCAPLAQKTE